MSSAFLYIPFSPSFNTISKWRWWPIFCKIIIIPQHILSTPFPSKITHVDGTLEGRSLNRYASIIGRQTYSWSHIHNHSWRIPLGEWERWIHSKKWQFHFQKWQVVHGIWAFSADMDLHALSQWKTRALKGAFLDWSCSPSGIRHRLFGWTWAIENECEIRQENTKDSPAHSLLFTINSRVLVIVRDCDDERVCRGMPGLFRSFRRTFVTWTALSGELTGFLWGLECTYIKRLIFSWGLSGTWYSRWVLGRAEWWRW